ncbi:MAG: N-acetylmuramoyl-L-alanine amidase [Clostridia bacterium]|nr:N-acetylmuramoyl-L-alanine amidase [Clostridia bacterium]
MNRKTETVLSAVCGFLAVTSFFLGAVLSIGGKSGQILPASAETETTETETKAEEKTIRVIIDPGHGGEDGGAVSADGVAEKTLNLTVALHLADMLEAAGIPVLLTREGDAGLYDGAVPGHRKMTDLKNRLSLAAEHPDAVLCSIHMNTYPAEQYRGTQIFYAPKTGGSEALAAGLRDAVRTSLQPDNKREIKPAGSSIFLLDRAPGTAVLIECGFLSNPAEAARLSDPGYQEKLAAVFCSAILAYLLNPSSP